MAPSSGAKKPTKSKTRPGGGVSKPKIKTKSAPPKQQKTKPSLAAQPKKKRRIYTEKELGIPKLNMITPVGVEKPRGKKKGKIYVDDQESMMTILSMVNAEKEGLIESKIAKARHMEEIREARLKEAEARQEEKKSKLEETKESIRKKRKRRKGDDGAM
ncbi:60S ribosomal subunit assembly/export protein [Glutinoglossum americanum]|uniref:60S ribosomal subunit assembly/export protein n=1 Tax=Glutinoglossum americanum TaxID=1670608 RepID=A0A9P8I039_9PEZI|nr:60S ribosomal subunit assembly/export protein [Glutinoglossum americanum]